MTQAVVMLVVWLNVAVAVCLCLFRTLWMFLGLSLRSATDVLGPRVAGTPDPRIPGLGAGENAHLAYWGGQMGRDALSVARAALGSVRYRLTVVWLGMTTRHLLLGRRPGGVRGRNWFTRTVMRAVAPGTAVGGAAGALLTAVFLVVVLAVLALLLLCVWLVMPALVLALRGVERLGTVGRAIRMTCPYPGCYRPFPLAVHLCPACSAPQRALRPGLRGALWQVCRCGQRLVTTWPAGRRALVIHCPHCDRPLPAGVGTTRTVHLPLVGGTSAGKTMLMAAMVEGLRAWSRTGPQTVEFASETDQRNAIALNLRLEHTGWALKTQGGQPRAVMLRVGRRGRRRLLYLYDPMGESLHEADSVRVQQYLAHADRVILVADVLADPGVRRALGTEDRVRADAAHPARQGPLDTYQRLTGELTALTGRRRRLPVATVVTKRDVLDRMTTRPGPGEGRIDDWLVTMGLGALVRGLGHDFAAARYWAVSAHAATGAGALESERLRAAEPVLWLLASTGLRVRIPPPPPRAGRGEGKE